jgi:hypothetical protein
VIEFYFCFFCFSLWFPFGWAFIVSFSLHCSFFSSSSLFSFEFDTKLFKVFFPLEVSSLLEVLLFFFFFWFYCVFKYASALDNLDVWPGNLKLEVCSRHGF